MSGGGELIVQGALDPDLGPPADAAPRPRRQSRRRSL